MSKTSAADLAGGNLHGSELQKLLLTLFRWSLCLQASTTSSLKMKKEKQHVAVCEQNHSRWVSRRHTRAEVHGARQAVMQLQPRGERTMEGFGRRPSGGSAMVPHRFVRTVGRGLCRIPGQR